MNYPDIDTLNKRFGTPGRIAFRTGETGHPILALVNQYGACEISLYGGHVLGYRPMGHTPVLFISKKSLFERLKMSVEMTVRHSLLSTLKPLFTAHWNQMMYHF